MKQWQMGEDGYEFTNFLAQINTIIIYGSKTYLCRWRVLAISCTR